MRAWPIIFTRTRILDHREEFPPRHVVHDHVQHTIVLESGVHIDDEWVGTHDKVLLLLFDMRLLPLLQHIRLGHGLHREILACTVVACGYNGDGEDDDDDDTATNNDTSTLEQAARSGLVAITRNN